MIESFSIEVVLSATTGKLLCQFSDLHRFLDYLSGEQLYTHQLPRACDQVIPYIYETYPELEFIEGPNFSGSQEEVENQVREFLDSLVKSKYPEEYAFEPMEGYVPKNMLEELIEMRGGSTEGIIPVIID